MMHDEREWEREVGKSGSVTCLKGGRGMIVGFHVVVHAVEDVLGWGTGNRGALGAHFVTGTGRGHGPDCDG